MLLGFNEVTQKEKRLSQKFKREKMPLKHQDTIPKAFGTQKIKFQ